MKLTATLVMFALGACGKSAEERGREEAKAAPAEPTTGPSASAPRPARDVIVGSDPKRFAFEKVTLLGATTTQLREAYGIEPRDLGATLTFTNALDIPNVPAKARDLHVDLFIMDDKVYEVSFSTRIELETELVAALTEVRGVPTGSLDRPEGLVFPTTPPTVMVRKQGSMTTPWLSISQTLPR